MQQSNTNIKSDKPVNTGDVERVLSVLGGGFLLGYALISRSKMSIPLGLLGALGLYRGASGNCPVYQGLNINRANTQLVNGTGQGISVRQSIVIDRPVETVYRFWRNLENLPRFMRHLDTVHAISSTRSHWIAKGPLNTAVEWEAEILFERQNQLIAWRSLPGSDVDNQGVVEFKPGPNGMQTEIAVSLHYHPPAGMIGASAAHILGASPDKEIRQDLKTLKEKMEAGELVNKQLGVD